MMRNQPAGFYLPCSDRLEQHGRCHSINESCPQGDVMAPQFLQVKVYFDSVDSKHCYSSSGRDDSLSDRESGRHTDCLDGTIYTATAGQSEHTRHRVTGTCVDVFGSAKLSSDCQAIIV